MVLPVRELRGVKFNSWGMRLFWNAVSLANEPFRTHQRIHPFAGKRSIWGDVFAQCPRFGSESLEALPRALVRHARFGELSSEAGRESLDLAEGGVFAF